METLHFESSCLDASNHVHLELICSQYERIQIVRVIYGYTKQPSTDQCQFSIYDCIQEGTSQNILLCNGQQTCSINLTKKEILSSSLVTNSVPTCPDFNYVQVNYACLPDSREICDRWKDQGPIIHLSHTFSKLRQDTRCHCKVRSSLINGQVLLRAREFNRQYANLKSLIMPKMNDYDCKKSTYVEIATDRSERKCMDMFPSNGNALFGSGSHNFTLTFVKNDPLSELFFFFELSASPVKQDHNVQVVCNWARRPKTESPTTTSILTSTVPLLDISTTSIVSNDEPTMTSLADTTEYEIEETMPTTTTVPIKKTKILKSKRKRTTTSSNNESFNTTTLSSTTIFASSTLDEDEEWSKIISLASAKAPPSKQLLTINNRTYLSAPQTIERKAGSPSNLVLLILLILVCLTLISLLIYCWTVKRPECFRRMRMNAKVAFVFCCEAGKLLCCSSNRAASISGTSTSTRRTRRFRRRRASSTVPDYQSSEYYMTETGNIGYTTQSIYDGGGDVKSIYTIDYDDDQTEYDRRRDVEHTC